MHRQKTCIFSIVAFYFQDSVSKKIKAITMVLFDLFLNIKGTDYRVV